MGLKIMCLFQIYTVIKYIYYIIKILVFSTYDQVSNFNLLKWKDWN